MKNVAYQPELNPVAKAELILEQYGTLVKTAEKVVKLRDAFERAQVKFTTENLSKLSSEEYNRIFKQPRPVMPSDDGPF